MPKEQEKGLKRLLFAIFNKNPAVARSIGRHSRAQKQKGPFNSSGEEIKG